MTTALVTTALACDPTDGAVLAQAATNFAYTVAGAPFPNDWVSGALAESLTGIGKSEPFVEAAGARVHV